MNRIEEIIKILVKVRNEGKNLGMVSTRNDIARQINQLYEPQPSQFSLLEEKQVEGIMTPTAEKLGFESFLPTVDMRLLTPVLETQRDQIIPLVRADMQREIGEWLDHKYHYKATVEVSSTDIAKLKSGTFSKEEEGC